MPMSDFPVIGGQFYFPLNRYFAFGVSGLVKSENDWFNMPKSEGYECHYWQGSLDLKISTFPAKLINPYFIFSLGAYNLDPIAPLVAPSESQSSRFSELIINKGTHIFTGGSFGVEITLCQFSFGARATAMTYEKVKYNGNKPVTQTDVNLIYLAFVGFHYKL